MLTQYPPGSEFVFGETAVRPAQRALVHQDKLVDVGNRAFDLLLLLLERKGTVVSRDLIMEQVWAGRVVSENTLEGQMSTLRRALGNDRDLIKTIAGKGYQFVGNVRQPNTVSTAPTEAHAEVEPRPHCIRIPALISPLIGRQNAVNQVSDILMSHRLVTLVGAGGVGKTRLAIEAAHAVSAMFDDEVIFVELAAIVSGAHLPSAIAASFGFPPGEGTMGLEKISPDIRDKRFLLLVDNCEHLVDSAAQIIETLLQLVPRATVLATSREALRIAGEYVYRVPSLDVPSEENEGDPGNFGAVQLLRERIGSSIGETTDNNASSLLIRICRQLDGIPLAIELAAACTQVFGIQGVADRLDNRFELLRNGARTALPRQKTLRAAVDWSYDLLSQKCKTVLNRLSVFADAFTLQSAQRMISDDELSPIEVTAAIVQLVNRSVLSVMLDSSTGLYRLLDTIRAYAQEKLHESGTHHEWSLNHARYFLDVFSFPEKLAADRADMNRDQTFGRFLSDLRAAIVWSFSSDGEQHTGVMLTVAGITPLMRAGLIEECLNNVNVALKALPRGSQQVSQPPSLKQWEMKLQAGRGACSLFQTAGANTSDAFAACLRLAEENCDVEYQLRGLWGGWICAYLNGRPDEALAFASRFNEIAPKSRRTGDHLAAKRFIAISLLCLGELDACHAKLEELRVPAETMPGSERIRFLYDERMLTHAALAQSLSFLGLHDEAKRDAQRALDDAQTLGHGPSICYALSEAVCTTALLADDRKRLEDAVNALSDATRRHRVSTWKARANMWSGLLELRAGHVHAYESLIAPALEAIGDARYCLILVPFLAETAIALARSGKAYEASTLLCRAVERARQTPGQLAVPEFQRAKAETILCDATKADREQVRQSFINSISLSQKRGFVAWAARGTASLGKLTRDEVDPNSA